MAFRVNVREGIHSRIRRADFGPAHLRLTDLCIGRAPAVQWTAPPDARSRAHSRMWQKICKESFRIPSDRGSWNKQPADLRYQTGNNAGWCPAITIRLIDIHRQFRSA